MFKLIFILRKKRRQGTIQAHSLLRFPTIFPIDSYNYLLGKNSRTTRKSSNHKYSYRGIITMNHNHTDRKIARMKTPKKKDKSWIEELHTCIDYKWKNAIEQDHYEYMPEFLEC